MMPSSTTCSLSPSEKNELITRNLQVCYVFHIISLIVHKDNFSLKIGLLTLAQPDIKEGKGQWRGSTFK